jgi:sterol desaturase/sphingolipid hydroxylase (fatty acid hydroxylase superfamily)
MELSINTPALLFPAISLVMLAYTNRFLSLSNRVRNLHDKYAAHEQKVIILGQIKNLKYRLKLIKRMQTLGVLSFLFCIGCMFLVYLQIFSLAHMVFACSLLLFAASLLLSLLEIRLSTRAIELELSDMEGLEDPSVLEYLKKKLEGKP